MSDSDSEYCSCGHLMRDHASDGNCPWCNEISVPRAVRRDLAFVARDGVVAWIDSEQMRQNYQARIDRELRKDDGSAQDCEQIAAALEKLKKYVRDWRPE